jgi:hypothetical protein
MLIVSKPVSKTHPLHPSLRRIKRFSTYLAAEMLDQISQELNIPNVKSFIISEFTPFALV